MRAILIAPLLIGLAACGGDGNGITDPDDDDNGIGSFEVTFTGAVSASANGAASFASVPNSGFAMVLAGGDGTTSVTVYRVPAGRPGTGSFQVSDALTANQQQSGIYVVGIAGGRAFGSTAGTLTVSSSSSSRLRGTLEFTAADGQGQVNVDVTFDARCVTVTAAGNCN